MAEPLTVRAVSFRAGAAYLLTNLPSRPQAPKTLSYSREAQIGFACSRRSAFRRTRE